MKKLILLAGLLCFFGASSARGLWQSPAVQRLKQDLRQTWQNAKACFHEAALSFHFKIEPP